LLEVTRHHSGNGKLIKGKLNDAPADGLFPAFSASGQDVWRNAFEHEGDAIIVSAVGARCGKCFLASGKWSAVANTHVVWPNPEHIERKFLWYRVNDERFWERSGSAQPFVVVRKTFERDFLLPPLPEQRRIVAEIEKQFTRLEAGVAALGRVQANLKRYRAAVLKAACEGRLVTSDLKTWKRLKVSEIGETVTGNTPPTSDKENLGDELPFFKPTDLDAGYNVREARQYLSSKGANHARVLPAGAVLVTCIGATIGKTGFARVDCATNQQINALVVNPKVAISRWAFWLFSSPLGQQQIKTKASATTLPILNKSKFEALEFPIPPLAEQTRIVAEVERRLSVVEELELVVTANLQRATRLRQSILQKAFTGNL
jgi:type I restriction enzyme S subunit